MTVEQFDISGDNRGDRDRGDRGDGFIRRGDGGRDEKSSWRRNDDRSDFRNRDQGGRSDDRNRSEGNWRSANKPRDDDRKERPKQEKGKS